MKWIQNLFVVMAIAVLGGCAGSGSSGGLFHNSDLPSCSNVSGHYHSNTPLGAERVGSRLWVERRIIFNSKVGGIVRLVAAHRANGEWQAPKDKWQVTITHGLLSQYPYDVNFDVRAEKTNLNSNRLQRRHVEVDLHIFGPKMGAYGETHTVRMVALKFQGHPDTDWAICPHY